MLAVRTGSSALRSPLGYERRVKRGIRLQSKRLDQFPQTADNTRNTTALPANSIDSILVELCPLTFIAHVLVLDRLKIHWFEFPHTAMTAARDTPQSSPAVYTLPQ